MFNQKYFLPAIICCALCSCQHPQRPASHKPSETSTSGAEHIVLSSGTAVDTARVHALLRQGISIEKDQPQQALEYFTKALEVPGIEAYPEGQAMIYMDIEVLYVQLHNIPRADSFSKLTASALSKMPSRFFNYKKHRLLKIIQLGAQAEQLLKNGKLDSAVALYTRELNMLDSVSSTNYPIYIGCYTGLATIAHEIDNMDQSLFYLDKAEALAKKYKDSSRLLSITTNKATAYLKRAQYDSARNAAAVALRLSRASGDIRNIGYNANTIAISLLYQSKPKAALPYSRMAMDATHKTTGTVNGYYILGYNYIELGEYQKATDLLIAGIRYAENSGKTLDLPNAYGQLSRAYDGLGNYKKAYEYRLKYSQIQDSMRGKEAAGRIAEVEAKYQVAAKEKKLAEANQALLQKQLELSHRRALLYIWIGGSSAFILLLLGFIYRRYVRSKYSRLKAALEGEEKERSRLARELHDGVISRLSLIKMDFSALPEQHAELQKLQHFNEIVNHLEESINELRTTSHNLLPDILVQAGLEEAIRIYCNKVNQTSGLDIVFQVIGRIPVLTQEFNLNIYRILQELINNIIKHSGARNILVQLQVKDEWMALTIDDDGGRPAEHTANTTGSGIGLHNLAQRIRILNGTMQTEHNPGSNSAYLEFNIKKALA